MQNEVNENYFIFVEYVSGVKVIPLGTEILLVNNEPNKTIDLNYNIDGPKVMKFPYDSIQNITFRSRVRMENANKKIQEHETKSLLISYALFGSTALIPATAVMNGLFENLSNNYDKVDYNEYYEIIIEATINNQPLRIMLNSDISPEVFINNIKRTN